MKTNTNTPEAKQPASAGCISRLVRALPLMQYKAGQHDLICDATGAGKDYLDDGCTAYESVCILMAKLDAAKQYIEEQHGEEAKRLKIFLNAHQDSEGFCCLPLYGTGDSSANEQGLATQPAKKDSASK